MGYLPTDWKSFLWGAAVVGLGVFFNAVVRKFGEDAYAALKPKWLGPKSFEGATGIPPRTLVLLPVSRPISCWWHMGSMDGQPAMQIVGDLNVTNISRHTIVVMGAKLRKPKAVGHALVRAQKSGTYSDTHRIPPNGISDLRFDFFVEPPICEKGQLFKGDVAIIDQFGNEHWLKRLEFRYN